MIELISEIVTGFEPTTGALTVLVIILILTYILFERFEATYL